MSDRLFDSVWGFGTLAMVLIFVVFESAAFVLQRPDELTYSAWVWRHLGTRDGWRGWHIPARIGVLVFLLWLAEHFAFGWI